MSYNRIFLSHKGVDKDIVRQYHDVLKSMGFRPWIDESDLTANKILIRGMSVGMSNSCAAVFFITPKFEDSRFLKTEIDDALQQKNIREDGFSIITLVFSDKQGKYGIVPEPLKKFVRKKPRTHLEGIRFIIEALPPQLKKNRGYLPLQYIVPPIAEEVALVGQNLSSRIGLDNNRYSKFLNELKTILNWSPSIRIVLLMMTPKALMSIHPKAAKHLRDLSLPRIEQLNKDFPNENRITVAFHPSATLSLIAVDWSHADRSFAMITPKFQRTTGIDDRLTMLLDEKDFDSASLTRMLLDAKNNDNEAHEASLRNAPDLLIHLLEEAGL